MKNREIFFTDSQFLNDYNERMSINKELDYFWGRNDKLYHKKFLELLKDLRVNKYEDSGYSYLSKEGTLSNCRYFIFSTSYEKDCLSMWRYYSKNNNVIGFNLEFSSIALDDEWFSRETSVAVETGEVIYNQNDKQDKILNAVNKLYNVWSVYKESQLLDDKIVNEFNSWILIASLFYKDVDFSRNMSIDLLQLFQQIN